MADRISISCSNCGAGLKIDAAKAGKKIKCPKCSEVFVAQSEDEDLEDLEELDEIEEEEVQPKRKGAQPAAGGRKGKKAPAKKSGGSGLIIGLIGGGVALLLLVGVGLYAAGAFGGKAAAPANAVAAAPANPPGPAASNPAPAGGHAAAMGGPAGGHAAAQTPTTAMAAAVRGAAPASAQPAASPATSTDPSAPGADLAWFPAETEMVMSLRFADLWQSPLIAALRGDPMIGPQLDSALAPLAKWGIDPGNDLESITVAAWGLDSAQSRHGFPGMAGQFGAPPTAMPEGSSTEPSGIAGPKFALHLVMKQPMPLSRIDELLKQDTEHPTQTELNTAGPIPTLKATRADGMSLGFGNSLMFGQTSPQSLLIGAGEVIEPAIARGRQTTHLKRFNDLSKKFNLLKPGVMPHLAMIVIPKNLPTPSNGQPPLPPGMPPWAAELNQTMQREAASFGLALQVAGGVTLQTVIGTKSAEGSQQLQQSLTSAIETAGMQYSEQREQFPPFAAELLDPLVASLKAEDAGSAVRITAGLPDSAQTQIAQLPTKIMGYMMTAGLKGGPGGQPGFPGMLPDGTLPPGFEGAGIGGPQALIPPGTPAIPARTATNLPDGAALAAKLYIKQTPPDRPNAPPQQLAVALTLQGLPSDADFLQLGKLTFKKILANGRQTMKANQVILNVASPHDDNDVLSIGTFPPTPEGEVLLGEALILPPRYAVNLLSTVEGTFLVRNGTAVKEFSVAEASSVLAEMTPDDDDLKSAGVKLKREAGKTKNSVGRLTEALVITADKGYALADLGLVDESGSEVAGAMTTEFVQGGNPGWKIYLDKETKLPPGLALKGRLIGGVQDQIVSFKFDDLRMPQPSQTGGQGPTETTGQPQPPGSTPMPSGSNQRPTTAPTAGGPGAGSVPMGSASQPTIAPTAGGPGPNSAHSGSQGTIAPVAGSAPGAGPSGGHAQSSSGGGKPAAPGSSPTAPSGGHAQTPGSKNTPQTPSSTGPSGPSGGHSQTPSAAPPTNPPKPK